MAANRYLKIKYKQNAQDTITSIYVPLCMIYMLALPAICTCSDEVVHLLATALYCTDSEGRVLLITGPLPSTVEEVIKSDTRSRIHPKAIVKVAQISKNISLPFDEKAREKILQEFKLYSDIMKADLSTVDTRKMLKTLWYYIIEERKRHSAVKAAAVKAANGTLEQEELNTEETVMTNNSLALMKNESSPDDYLPNDIYYAVEKKCANWADGCGTKSPSILEMSSQYFKVPLGQMQPPRKLRWDP